MIEAAELRSDAIVQIGAVDQPRLFTLSEARQLLPVVRKVTEVAHRNLAPCRERMRQMLNCDPRLAALECEFETAVRKWVARMLRLGVMVPGLWQVGFDTGEGYLCWRLPELRLAYFCGYADDFDARRPLAEVIDEWSPDWANH
ncbi:MAG TPA: DUF2203 domain-containing protein [Gammaproteobacteria bacterium]|jgi:hypothetical protein|nr:DUF2203 family protein [Arenicellales bacterium]MDP6531463.1 DUF2203 family protein [Arenicellales bacterium]MDP6855185.1 DUF2203 family protein [Arenicellales bacterium]HCY12731.1 DUF2203 domain-containing protein [Gammaproteobacteria bacterium]|tara:strand:- start:156 stop:587 length:432 start_codon:yes stop_codon:yes gene_type:complete